MKYIHKFNHFMYSDRFSFFDNLVMFIFVGLTISTGSYMWLLAIIPAAIVGAVLSVKFGSTRTENKSQ